MSGKLSMYVRPRLVAPMAVMVQSLPWRFRLARIMALWLPCTDRL